MSYSNVRSNFTMLSIGEAFTRLLTFLMTVYISRILGASDFGIIAFATSVLAYGGVFVDLGLTYWGRREAARAQIPPARLVSMVTALRLCLVPVALLGIVLLALFGSVPEGSQTVLLIYAASLLIEALDLSWFFLGSGNVRPVFMSGLVGQAALTALVLAFAHSAAELLLIPIFYLAGRVITALMLMIAFIRAERGFRPGFEWGQVRQIAGAALPFSGTHIASSTYAHFDIIFVGLVLTTADSSYYGVAYRTLWITLIITTSYFSAIGPVIARSFVTGLASIHDFLRQTLTLSVAGMVGIVVGGIVVARPLIVFLFGEEFAPAALPFQILLAAEFGGMILTNHQRLLLEAFEHQRINFFAFVGAIVLNLIGNLLLVPRFGIVGAALALLISRTALMLAAYFGVWRYVERVPIERYLPKPLIAAAAMVGVLWLVSGWHVILQVMVGGAVYGIGLLALGVIKPAQVRAMLGDLGRRGSESTPRAAGLE